MTDTLSRTLHDSVQEYYGETLQGSGDLKTNACTCDAEAPSKGVREALRRVHPEILERFYGCGSPIPPALEGCTVLDLGCGTGRDVYVAAQLVGASGRVIGVDMTEAQLAVALRYETEQARRSGYALPNTTFLHGQIENLAALGIENDSVDVVISNCVINLSPHKDRVLAEIFRVLKPGGELYFSDVFADRRIPAELRNDPVLHGECLAGAMYEEDFRRLLTEVGFPDFRVTQRSALAIGDEAIESRIGFVTFSSVTVRAFKLEGLEDACEDYGQMITYRGTCPEMPHRFHLDEHHVFPAGKPVPVCGNTASMLSESRYSLFFEVSGDRSRHFGLFPCEHPQSPAPSPVSGSCC